jgi:predicted GNAT family acetyltransferase
VDLPSLEAANPGNWPPDEWQDLLAGRLGAWVMALVDGRVASICHTPRLNARAAEAGTWTRTDFRGRGLAAACTAEWAQLLRPSGRLLFYSTSRSNRSSQRVAARLGLHQLGCLWQLRRA